MDKLSELLKPFTPFLEKAILSLGGSGFNLLFILLIGGSLFLFLRTTKRFQKLSALRHLRKVSVKTRTGENQAKRQLNFFRKFQEQIDLYYLFKSNKSRARLVYVGTLGAEVLVFIGFLMWQKILLAIVFPVMIHWFVVKYLKLRTETIHDFVQRDLPLVTKHMVKVMSSSSDLKTILYEVSGSLREPLRSKFFDLSRRMVTENYEKALLEFSDDIDDTWMYAFVFLILSYKESSRKEDIIRNLTLLGNMLQTENDIREKGIIEQKATVFLNYALVSAGIAALVGNLIFNKASMDFFFGSVMGMAALLVGVFAIFGTFILNLTLTHTSK